MAKIKILSPLSGQVWALERVPDPVFAQKMVGDGLSIDPVDAVLLAACDGEIVSVHPAGHAVTLRTAEGMELIMHVGIDTVMLKGEGFIPRVKAGDRVQAGAPLIQFDLDFLATHAKSLLTQIVVANTERVTSWERASGFVSAGKNTLFSVTFTAPDDAASTEGAQTVTSEAVVIPNRTGLHARPAAVLQISPGVFSRRSNCKWGSNRPMHERYRDHGAGRTVRSEGATGGHRSRRIGGGRKALRNPGARVW